MLKCSDCKMVYCHASCAAKVMTDEDDAWVCKACVIRQRRAAKDKKQKKRKKEKHVYCQIEEFHIDCVGLKTRRRNWYCKDCLEMYPEFPEEEKLKIGLSIEVYWPLDKKWYRGKVHEIEEKKSSTSVEIHYDDGDIQIHPLHGLKWRVVNTDKRKKKRRRKV